MADYKSIKGVRIQNFTTDPDNPITGQVWYNESVQAMKFQYPTTINAWSTGGNLNTTRGANAGTGTQTSALSFGGQNPSPGILGETESYNGTSWTELNDLNTARRVLSGAGSDNTSALAFGGTTSLPAGPGTTAVTESWNGTSWTEVNDLNTARLFFDNAAGTQTSALALPGIGVTSSTESWNGTSWTEVSDFNTARANTGGTGTDNTSAIAFGGDPVSALTETWNGSSWTEVNDMNTGRIQLGAAGTVPSAIGYGGETPSYSGVTESWNGTSWTEVADLSIARSKLGSTGSSNASALAIGGDSPPTGGYTASTEEWNTGIPVGAWSTGGSLNTGRYGMASSGTQTSTIAMGGRISPPNVVQSLTESYNGTSWTEVNDLNAAKFIGGSTTGPSTAALLFGGNTGSNSATNESWNGTSWTELGDLNTARANLAGVGTSTDALGAGGANASGLTETWNGTSWTEVADLNTARNGVNANALGVDTTAAIVAGGEQPGPPYAIYANVESWNGSSWTEVNDLNTGRHQKGSAGTTTSGLIFGGTPPNTGATEEWNGTSWTETSDLSTARGYPAGSGSSSSAIATGGIIPPGASTTATEEWTKPSFTPKTITQS